MAKLHCFEFSKKEKMPAKVQTKTNSYIMKSSDGFYDDLLEGEQEIEVFMQLSELRKGLYDWYDFKPETEILEIDAGFGALTGLFCEKAGHVSVTEPSLFQAESLNRRYQNVNNLEIYAADVKRVQFQKKFDYIILTGVLEKIENPFGIQNVYEEYLKGLSGLLKEHGKILIAVDNRYGLKYFCGSEDPYTKIPFAGMNRFGTDKNGHLFSRKELMEILEQAGLKEYKFYYPLPDYKLPQMIYSQNYLPETNIRERLIPYYENPDTLVLNEKLLYDDVVKNGAFEFLANSFLVECGKTCEFCKVDYATVSRDRGKKRSFVTKIYSDGKVIKKPLYEEGKKTAREFVSHMLELQKTGIPVVSCSLMPDGIVMPYVKAETLSNYLKKLVKTDQQSFLNIFDELYKYILMSSEQVPQSENALCKKLGVSKELKWGPVLKRAYIELIPLNCFYSKEYKYVFFDQEFVRENYPAKYILYRAIKYVYCFTPEAEAYVPLETLKEKYDMVQIWDLFQAEEDKFLEKVRNHKRYEQFYQWARLDPGQMQENAKKLGKTKQEEFAVSDKMKKIWAVELDLLEQLDKVCRRNKLRYFLIHGTLLGAVRHRGFIPWDDDLDVVMPRRDYDKLKEIGDFEFKFPYFLQTPENDPDTYNNGHLRLRNSNTTGMETKDIGHKCNLGIWIDILVLDDGVLKEKQKEKKRKKIIRAQYLLRAKTYGKEVKQYGVMGTSEWGRYVFVSRFLSRKYLCAKLEKARLSYCSKKSPDVLIYGEGKYQAFARKDFKDAVYLEFEGHHYPAPAGYKHWLDVIMGRDYMKLPPPENRRPKHQGVFDTEKPFTEYNRLFSELFLNAEGKKIVLFGAGLMSEDYMRKHAGRHKPDFIVDNDELKWDTEKYGIPVKSPETLHEVPQEKLHLIICSYYYKEIEKQLEDMGIKNYRIYIQNTSWITDAER